jgi:uncharacterized membrane protein YeaQ/YmgE (transglycosylase-associated protein family)
VSFIVYLIILFLWGLVVGAFARLALPGPDPMTLWQTALLGIAGSLLAGIVVWLISGGRAAPGFLVSLVFTVGILYFIRRSRGGGLTRPGGRDVRRS